MRVHMRHVFLLKKTATMLMTIHSCDVATVKKKQNGKNKAIKCTKIAMIYAVVGKMVIIIIIIIIVFVVFICSANILLFVERGKFVCIFMICWCTCNALAHVQSVYPNNSIDTDINNNGQCSSVFNFIYEHSTTTTNCPPVYSQCHPTVIENNVFFSLLCCLFIESKLYYMCLHSYT